MNPTPDEINAVSRAIVESVDEKRSPLLKPTLIEFADGDPLPWQSDAQKEGLPTVNISDGKGAPLLDRDAVLRASYPNHARK